MTDLPVAVRAFALSEAVKYAAILKIDGAAAIISVASLFNDFLRNFTSDETEVAAIVANTKPIAVKPAKAAKAKAEPVVETDDEGADVPTKADVGSVVEKLLGADKRTEAVALMKKFGATSVSTLAEGKYAAFIEAADAILMTA